MPLTKPRVAEACIRELAPQERGRMIAKLEALPNVVLKNALLNDHHDDETIVSWLREKISASDQSGPGPAAGAPGVAPLDVEGLANALAAALENASFPGLVNALTVSLQGVVGDAIATGVKLAVGKCIVRKAGEGAV